MNGEDRVQRPLFGGAISSCFPLRFQVSSFCCMRIVLLPLVIGYSMTCYFVESGCKQHTASPRSSGSLQFKPGLVLSLIVYKI